MSEQMWTVVLTAVVTLLIGAALWDTALRVRDWWRRR
jgi:hypothetical protein